MVATLKKSKRLMLMYVIIFMWLGIGVMGVIYGTSFASLAVYFLSLTGFVASYIWGESARPAISSSVFQSGRSSTREIVIYMCVLLWAAIGVFGILRNANMEELAAYYSALTPFVGSYIIGVSYKPTLESQQPAG